ncbi:hypothetical protein MJO29_013453 [Puccinia striiformis f. sp. tritici]|uniref:Uncharacterized protein n=1 Tax=Puccinia striiformis f. sp. tritici PST-78 TaxID=1165861 RepID=A0A0L0VWR5_9BASI|nr:hypothetical protein MJO29_013453 [Puccinia striiformis f. sp. tritici]KNF03627.1 hypothetical protein PSTG_03149 [Puccinia striiformis f. sp. tritici PST-78]
MHSNTQQLKDFQSIFKHDMDQIGQPQGNCLGFDLFAPVEFALESEDKNADFGSVQSPTGDTQDPSELGELQLDNGSDCDSRVDIGIDVDLAQYDEPCSHSSSATITSPNLELVPSTDNCHEPTHSPDPLQTKDIPNY